MRKYLLFISFLFLVTTAKADDSVSVEQARPQKNKAELEAESHYVPYELMIGRFMQYQSHLLSSAYQDNSEQKLAEFLKAWAGVSVPNSMR